jgi:hypothetical protein
MTAEQLATQVTGMVAEHGVPPIPPVPDGPRPFWSVMIPSYNGDPHLAETLEGVLAQDLGPEHMQIEVVDDCSTHGAPEELVRRIAGDRVGFHRQARNVGHIANFNTCIRRARGEVVHILHDDDRVRPGFYARLENPLREHPEVGAAFTRNIYADADGQWHSFSPVERPTPGILENWLNRIASGQRTTTPAVVVRRSTYETLGGFDETLGRAGEDWEMWVRIATRFQVWFEPEPLAIYRMERPDSLTGAIRGSARLAQDMLIATDIVESYLSSYLEAERAATALRKAREMYSRWGIEAAYGLARAGRRQEALAAGRLAWRATSPTTVAKAVIRALINVRLTGRARG